MSQLLKARQHIWSLQEGEDGMLGSNGGQQGSAAPRDPPSHLPDVLFLCTEQRKSLFPLSGAVPAFGRTVLAFGCPQLTPARSDDQREDLPSQSQAGKLPAFPPHGDGGFPQPVVWYCPDPLSGQISEAFRNMALILRGFGGEELVCSPLYERGN